jgi:succinate dehydrogenase/fumarate reductase-like Fe-S protein
MQLGTPRYRWEDNIKMYVKKLWLCKVKSIQQAQHRHQKQTVFKTVMKFAGSINCGECFSKCMTVMFLRWTLCHRVTDS